jgi:ligand-binding SRPBCC domain-containing protein
MQFIRESRINAPPEAVFAFHESPGALLRLTPPWEDAKVVAGGTSITTGSRVVIETKVGLFPLRMVALHTEYDPPHLFADRQESGPFGSWYHRHRFLDDGEGGTILRDEIEYDPPMGWIGKLLSDGLIEQRLDRMFAFRHAETKRIVESGDYPGAASPA